MSYGHLVIVLSTVLRIKRTLDGAEIDKIISDVQVGKASALERRRRADWRKCELPPAAFARNTSCPRSGAVNQRRFNQKARRM
jgi:hypothetical protein